VHWLPDVIVTFHAFGRLTAAVFVLSLIGCAGGSSPPPIPETLSLSEPSEYLGSVVVREPMVVEHPEGVLFVAGYSQAIEESMQPPKLFRSLDRGKSWEPVHVGTAEQGAVGNSDVDLAVAPDGTLYFLTMGFDRSTGEGTHVSVGVSRDVGESWTRMFHSQDRFDDRPWIAVAPDGAVTVIWNDGDGVRIAVSTDAGQTWAEHARIHPQGHSSHLAVGPEGQIAVRITPLSASGNRYHEGVDLIALSVDAGATWRKHTPPGNRVWSSEISSPGNIPRWVEPIAWDAAGALFYLWSEGSALWLGRSTDLGQSWESWMIVSGQQPLFFPFLVARGPGELAATWFSGTGNDLSAQVAVIDANGSSAPSVRASKPFQIDSWSRTSELPLRDPGGEYLPLVFLSHGGLGVAAPIQNLREGRKGFSWYTTQD
jgi:hypothetical protein